MQNAPGFLRSHEGRGGDSIARWYRSAMKRVVVLGRGAAGKSTLARHLGEVTGLPVIEVDKLFWRSGLVPTPRAEWTELQEQLVQTDSWILDGDLGPRDAVEVRLRAADTIILLDFALFRCAWRAVCRAPERPDFWRWVLAYRRRSMLRLSHAISRYAPNADLHLLRSPEAVKEFIAVVARQLRIAGEQLRPPPAP